MLCSNDPHISTMTTFQGWADGEMSDEWTDGSISLGHALFGLEGEEEEEEFKRDNRKEAALLHILEQVVD